MRHQQILFIKKSTAKLCNVAARTLATDEVMVQTVVSTVSCGTERANIMGDPNVSPNEESSVAFPRASGYSSAGIIIEKGDAVKSLEVGDRVAVFWGYHKNYNIVRENQVVKIENPDVSFQTGAMSFIATFPMAAIRKTRIEIGESAIVMGLGILGMIAVKLLRVAGATPIIAADPNPGRREIALRNGADFAFDPFKEDFVEKVMAITDGGANVAIEVTGVGAGFIEALDCMAKFGRVALLGCTRNSDFTVDYYKKIHGPGITVIGAHTQARPQTESHPGWYTHRDDIKAVLKLCGSGRLDLEGLVEETHSPRNCEEVYHRLVSDSDFPIVVQFDWRDID